MYLKDYSEAYVEVQEANIEIILKDMHSNKIDDKIIIWKGDFDSILSKIPLNEDGEYIVLAYHQNIDFPWDKIEANYWIMDYLNESLEQVNYVKDNMEDDVRKDICEDIYRIISKAINSEKSNLVRRN